MKPEFFCAEDERDWLRQQLAASQARELQLRDALKTCQKKQIIYECRPTDNYKTYDSVLVEKALALPSDTTALESLIKKASEVMRERAARESERDACPAYEYVSTAVPGQSIAVRIRALPAVTLDDLKGGES